MRRCSLGCSPGNISKAGGDLQTQPTESNRSPAAETQKKVFGNERKSHEQEHEDLHKKIKIEVIHPGPVPLSLLLPHLYG